MNKIAWMKAFSPPQLITTHHNSHHDGYFITGAAHVLEGLGLKQTVWPLPLTSPHVRLDEYSMMESVLQSAHSAHDNESFQP